LCFLVALLNAFFAVFDLLVGFALNFINRAKLGITIVMLTLSVDRSKYQQTDANEGSGVDTQSQQDKNTVDSLKKSQIGYNYCDAHFVRFCLTHAIPHHFLGFGFGFGFGISANRCQ
jgi:hypothetical protein